MFDVTVRQQLIRERHKSLRQYKTFVNQVLQEVRPFFSSEEQEELKELTHVLIAPLPISKIF
jgi:hypothetical protein